MEAIVAWLESTMIIERCVSCLVYVLALAIAYNLVKKTGSYTQLKRVLHIYLLVLTVMGFFFIPDSSKDLYRIMENADEWLQYSFGYVIKNIIFKTDTPVSYLYIYLARLTGIDGVLPAFCSLVFHYNIFAILKKIYKYCNVRGRSLALALLFFMCMGRFLEAISGVRSFVAISILSNCFITELYSDRIYLRTVLLEVLACLMHPIAIAVYAIRLSFIFIQKSKSAVLKIITMLIVLAGIVFAACFGRYYIVSAFNKFIGYVTTPHYSYMWEYIIGAVMWLTSVFTVYAVKDVIGNSNSMFLKNLLSFCKILLFINLLCVFEYSTFHRLGTFVCMMMLPLVAVAYEYSSSRRYTQYIKILLILVMLLVYARGDLCGYTFFLL